MSSGRLWSFSTSSRPITRETPHSLSLRLQLLLSGDGDHLYPRRASNLTAKQPTPPVAPVTTISPSSGLTPLS